MAALELLADPVKLKKKLDQFAEAESRAREIVALAGPASEVLELREKLKTQLEAQEQATLEAKEASKLLLHEARNKAQAVVSEAEAQAEELKAEAEAMRATAAAELANAQRIRVAADDALEAARVKADNLEKGLGSLANRESELTAAMQELSKERDSLMALSEYIRNAVAR